jgi:hypothetical protein
MLRYNMGKRERENERERGGGRERERMRKIVKKKSMRGRHK